MMASSEEDGGDDVVLMSDEFSIAQDKIPLLEDHKDRIEELFKVEIDYGLHALNDKMQWVTVSGEKENRERARDHVRALCNPVKSITVDYPPALHSVLCHSAAHGKLEKQSHAVILFPEVGKATIQGNDDLAITLAMSALEDLITKYESETERGQAALSPQARQASLRLEAELRRLSSQDKSIEYDEDYSRMPDVVKRTILGWFLDESPRNEIPHQRHIRYNDDDIEDITDTIEQTDLQDSTPDIDVEDVNQDSDEESVKQHFLELGAEEGYTRDEISDVLDVFDTMLTDDEFILALKTNRKTKSEPNNGSKLGASDHPMEQMLIRQSPHLQKKQAQKKAQKKEKGKNRRKKNKATKGNVSADDYLELLTRDFKEEGGEMDLGVLKERSAHRINMLQQALDMEPVITDIRVNNKEGGASDDDSVGIAKDEPDWKLASKKRHQRNQPYQKKAKAQPYQQQEGYSDKSDQFQQPGLRARSNHRSYSPRRASPNRFAARGPESPAHYNDLNKQSPSRQHHSRISPSRFSRSATGFNRRSPNRDSRTGGATVPSGPKQLRYIIIDGSNMAMTHGNEKFFSCRGIEICVNYFLKRGHKEVTVFVPQWRTQVNPRYPIQDQEILHNLRDKGYLVFTPARKFPGKKIACYDDRFVLRLAVETEGIIVSNDNYRDLWYENTDYRSAIENRLLPYSFVGDFFMPPEDPLGRNGPKLDDFLTKQDESNGDYRSWGDTRTRTHSEGERYVNHGHGEQYGNQEQGTQFGFDRQVRPRMFNKPVRQVHYGRGNPQHLHQIRSAYPTNRPSARALYQYQGQNRGQYSSSPQDYNSYGYAAEEEHKNQSTKASSSTPELAPSVHYARGNQFMGAYPTNDRHSAQAFYQYEGQNQGEYSSSSQDYNSYGYEDHQTKPAEEQHRSQSTTAASSTSESAPLEQGRPANRTWLRAQLLGIFPQNGDDIDRVLANHPQEQNPNKLSSYVLEVVNDSHWSQH